MSPVNEFEGVDKPTVGDPDLELSLVIRYLRVREGLQPKDFISVSRKDPEHPERFLITNATFTNLDGGKASSRPPSISPLAYKEMTRLIMNRYFFWTDDRLDTTLRKSDPFVSEYIFRLLPLAKKSFVDPFVDAALFSRAANTNGQSLQDVYDAFSNGAFIYRWAQNSTEQHKENPRIAVGYMEALEIKETHITYRIHYKSTNHGSADKFIHSTIEGKLYLIQGFQYYPGITMQGDKSGFFMVLRDNLAGNHNGGLIIRKHSDLSKADHFASKVVVVRNKDPIDNFIDLIGPFDEKQILQRISSEDLQKFLNIPDGHPDGKGGLHMPNYTGS